MGPQRCYCVNYGQSSLLNCVPSAMKNCSETLTGNPFIVAENGITVQQILEPQAKKYEMYEMLWHISFRCNTFGLHFWIQLNQNRIIAHEKAKVFANVLKLKLDVIQKVKSCPCL